MIWHLLLLVLTTGITGTVNTMQNKAISSSQSITHLSSLSLNTIPPELMTTIFTYAITDAPIAYKALRSLSNIGMVNKRLHHHIKELQAHIKSSVQPHVNNTCNTTTTAAHIMILMLTKRFSQEELQAAMMSINDVKKTQRQLQADKERLGIFNNNHFAWGAYFGNKAMVEYLHHHVHASRAYRSNDPLQLPALMLAMLGNHITIVQYLIDHLKVNLDITHHVTREQLNTLFTPAEQKSAAFKQLLNNNKKAGLSLSPVYAITPALCAQIKGSTMYALFKNSRSNTSGEKTITYNEEYDIYGCHFLIGLSTLSTRYYSRSTVYTYYSTVDSTRYMKIKR